MEASFTSVQCIMKKKKKKMLCQNKTKQFYFTKSITGKMYFDLELALNSVQ